MGRKEEKNIKPQSERPAKDILIEHQEMIDKHTDYLTNLGSAEDITDLFELQELSIGNNNEMVYN